MNISPPADRGTLDRGGLRLRILLLGGLMIGAALFILLMVTRGFKVRK